MKIIAADIYDIDLHPWKPPIILRLITDEGIYGLGEFPLAYGTGRQAAIAMTKEMVEHYVIGADPMQIEAMWHTLFRRTFWGQGGGPVVYGGISTIDEALWDIKGKALGRPIYDLLGGKVRDTIPVYANGWYSGEWAPGNNRVPATVEELGEFAAQVVALGYKGLKFNPFFAPRGERRPGHERVLEPWRADLGYARVKAVRDTVGPDVAIMVECHGWFGPASAIEMGRRLVDLNPYFYEEPVDAMNVACMKRLPTTCLSRSLLANACHALRLPRVHRAAGHRHPAARHRDGGGITEVKKIAAYAETYDLYVQPHNCRRPIATAAAAQIDACITNFLIQEMVPFREPIAYELVNEPLDTQITDSAMPVPEGRGLASR